MAAPQLLASYRGDKGKLQTGGSVMAWRKSAVGGPADIAAQTTSALEGGRLAAILSAVALAFSGYSLWETSLRQSDLRVFVPPVIYYSAPYQNTNFEMISIPVTLINEGARTGTALYFELNATDPRNGQTKRFYSAEFGVWSMERTRARAYTGFAPISLPGHASRTESILFYTQGNEQKPDQLIREVGPYKFTLRVVQAENDDFGWLDRIWSRKPVAATFERVLPFYDARSFDVGTIFMHSKDWAASSSNDAK
jgi:hypothetical protein